MLNAEDRHLVTDTSAPATTEEKQDMSLSTVGQPSTPQNWNSISHQQHNSVYHITILSFSNFSLKDYHQIFNLKGTFSVILVDEGSIMVEVIKKGKE